MTRLKKPTYYLWKTDFPTCEEFEKVREKYIKIGFRVVTFQDGRADRDINEGMKAVIKNHMQDDYS